MEFQDNLWATRAQCHGLTISVNIDDIRQKCTFQVKPHWNKGDATQGMWCKTFDMDGWDDSVIYGLLAAAYHGATHGDAGYSVPAECRAAVLTDELYHEGNRLRSTATQY